MPNDRDQLLEVISYIQIVQRRYPRLAPFLDIPQVGRLILLLASEEIELDEFERRLRNTSFWRNTAEAERRWQVLQYADPATARARLDARTASVRDMIRQNGIRLPQGMTVRDIARHSIVRDLSEEQLTDYIFSFTSFRDEGQGPDGAAGDGTYVPRGALGATILQLRDLGRQYMITLDPKQTFKYARSILNGTQTVDGIAAIYAQAAITRWGSNQTLRDFIAGGGTPADYFTPYRQMIAEELELPEDGVDLLDARYNAVLNYAAAPVQNADSPGGTMGTGGTVPVDSAFRPMTLSEARTWIRRRPEWNQTRRAQTMSSSLGETILRRFGAVA